MKQAALTWEAEGLPRSTTYDDIYFSAGDGLAESRHVFLEANQLPEAWLKTQRFTIAELGFGSGLNFLACWQSWNRTAPSHHELHFISFEKHPLSAEDIHRALEPWPCLADLKRSLLEQYPPPREGVHDLRFDTVRLSLIQGDAALWLPRWSEPVDAWFLDGFSPKKNPDLWAPEIFAQVARLSRRGTTLSSFTAAGQVRRNLARAGFAMEIFPGFGRKRHMLRGRFKAGPIHQN